MLFLGVEIVWPIVALFAGLRCFCTIVFKKIEVCDKIFRFFFAGIKIIVTFATQLRVATFRAFSSAGLEHLPYKQRVGGSNPSTPTEEVACESRFFLFTAV